jgi:hypothetical protein
MTRENTGEVAEESTATMRMIVLLVGVLNIDDTDAVHCARQAIKEILETRDTTLTTLLGVTGTSENEMMTTHFTAIKDVIALLGNAIAGRIPHSDEEQIMTVTMKAKIAMSAESIIRGDVDEV